MGLDPLTLEQLQKAKELFAAANALGDGGLPIAENECEDPQLRALLDRMLRADRTSSPILDQPLTLSAAAVACKISAGDVVGRYRIIAQIGAGGMGTVYLAEGADLEDGRQFALKVIRWLPPELLRRFEREETILKAVSHPNIASLVDTGITEQGSPYLAMEYVAGETITAYCDRGKLAIVERIRIFRQLCSALCYLHQNLIVHRDLKPSNVLVTSTGVVKLVDFGIAKLLQSEQSPGTPDTTLHLMTPDYASPEQVRGVTVGTLTDVYGAGLLLYEVLTGRNPFSVGEREMHEVLRAICEDEPEKPSVAVAHFDAKKANAQALSSELRGELDNIVLKAMRKEPERRYASIEQLDDDLERYLTNEPVLAQGDSVSYRLRKFVRRERAWVSFAAILLLVLVAGVAATSFEASLARRERARAELHAAAAEKARVEAETQTFKAEEEQRRAEAASREANHQKVMAERRLAELEQAAQNAAELYKSHENSESPESAQIAQNTRDVLLTLQRESPLSPALARLLGTMPAHGDVPPGRAWHVPSGWWAGQSKPDEYTVEVDHTVAHRGKASLVMRSQKVHPEGVVTVGQNFSATRYRGKRLRVSAYLKADEIATAGFLYVTCSKAGTENPVFERVTVSGTRSWTSYSVVVQVPDEMESISIGAQLMGSGMLHADDFAVEIVDRSVPLTTSDAPYNLEFQN